MSQFSKLFLIFPFLFQSYFLPLFSKLKNFYKGPYLHFIDKLYLVMKFTDIQNWFMITFSFKNNIKFNILYVLIKIISFKKYLEILSNSDLLINLN